MGYPYIENPPFGIIESPGSRVDYYLWTRFPRSQSIKSCKAQPPNLAADHDRMCFFCVLCPALLATHHDEDAMG